MYAARRLGYDSGDETVVKSVNTKERESAKPAAFAVEERICWELDSEIERVSFSSEAKREHSVSNLFDFLVWTDNSLRRVSQSD